MLRYCTASATCLASTVSDPPKWDGAGHLENAVVGAGGKTQAAHRNFQGPLSGVIQSADLADRASGNTGIVLAARLWHRPGLFPRGRGFRPRTRCWIRRAIP